MAESPRPSVSSLPSRVASPCGPVTDTEAPWRMCWLVVVPLEAYQWHFGNVVLRLTPLLPSVRMAELHIPHGYRFTSS